MALHTIVLLSGGYDSVYCLLKNENYLRAKCLFFNYGQPYLEEEQEAVRVLKYFFNLDCEEIFMDSLNRTGGTFTDRNETFLRMAARRTPDEIYFGTRNLLPLFDKHGDSNWWWAKKMSRQLGVPIRTPAVGLLKSTIINRVRATGVPAKGVYSSEGYKYG